MTMKKFMIFISVLIVTINAFSQKGIINWNVFENSINITHQKYVPCLTTFMTNVNLIGDTIMVYESMSDTETDCLCNYDVTTIIDSIDNGNYSILYYCISPNFPNDTTLCHSFTCNVNSMYYGTVTKTTLQSECLNAIEPNQIINESYLKQNHPNPFNNETTIEFIIKDNYGARIEVYNSFGLLILSKEFNQFGLVNFRINHNNKLKSGIYYYKMYANGRTETKKMICIK